MMIELNEKLSQIRQCHLLGLARSTYLISLNRQVMLIWFCYERWTSNT
ncbi:hypothetical protein [Nitrosomonas sp.]